jgi:hypothetical protein
MVASGGRDNMVWARGLNGAGADASFFFSFLPFKTPLSIPPRSLQVRIWDGSTGKPIGIPLAGHKNYITWLSWEPLHSCGGKCTRVASSSKVRSMQDAIPAFYVYAFAPNTHWPGGIKHLTRMGTSACGTL